MSSTRVHRHIRAPRARVYRALLDPREVAAWMVPDGMTAHVHAFDPREGCAFRVSLTYDAPTGTGKTTPHTDTYHGRFLELVPDQRVVRVVEFETVAPADNDLGWRMSLDKLAALVEAPRSPPRS